MRIIAGESRGAQLETLPGQCTRPTLERVKEGMFSAVQFWLPGARVLDLFSGSGQLGLEALSRGAAFCTFVESDKRAAAVIRRNAEVARLSDRCSIRQVPAEAFLARPRETYDLVLLDPPYDSGVLPGLLGQLPPVCGAGAEVLCETGPKVQMPQNAGGLQLQKCYRYGAVLVWRYRMAEEPGI